jgi:hypothetical protein
VAQWLTHSTCNRKIPGSTPGTSSFLFRLTTIDPPVKVFPVRRLILHIMSTNRCHVSIIYVAKTRNTYIFSDTLPSICFFDTLFLALKSQIENGLLTAHTILLFPQNKYEKGTHYACFLLFRRSITLFWIPLEC